MNVGDGLPVLRRKGLRDCQYEAVSELEKTFRAGQRRALIEIATGAGKTYTACMAAYRLLSYTPMHRVLFLVDRNNLGKQAEGEFAMFRLTQNGDAFNTIFGVERLKRNTIPADSNVVISTIQRLFSFLSGREVTDTEEDDEGDTTEGEVLLPENPKLPHDYFDLIIIDECHRSIYGNWRKVLEYFDTARLVGLTATPVPETLSFFNNNRIVNYTLEKSYVDGVNVDSQTYRIKTQVTENGGAILQGERTLIYKGFSEEEAKTSTEEFEKYCLAHKDDIEALRILYNHEGEPITYGMLLDLQNRLKRENNRLTSKQLWNSYALVAPGSVRHATCKEERESITNIIQLVRFAYHQIERLDSIYSTANQYFNLWCGHKWRDLTDKQKELMASIVGYIASNGACTVRDIREEDTSQAARFIQAFGGMKTADEALLSLFKFIVYRKTA